MTDRSLESLSFGLCALIFVVLAYQAIYWRDAIIPPKPTPKALMQEVLCTGTPIFVNEPYLGGPIDPHSCLPQCDDDQPRYLIYTNGKATQCETPPGCNDYGEDRGITCKAPQMTEATK